MTLTWPARNRKLGLIDALGLAGLLGFLVARYIPVARLPFWSCSFRRLTGWPCLGCGLTRVADRLSHGNLAGAWDANPLGTVAALLLGLTTVAMVLHLAFAVPVPDISLSRREGLVVRVGVVVLVLVNYAFVVVKTRFPWLLA